MISHQQRVTVLASLVALALVALGVLLYLGHDATELAAVSGALAVLMPALLDSIGVERRRRDPSVPALVDDVLAPPSERRDAGQSDEQGQ